jgi:hypothetical protein
MTPSTGSSAGNAEDLHRVVGPEPEQEVREVDDVVRVQVRQEDRAHGRSARGRAAAVHRDPGSPELRMDAFPAVDDVRVIADDDRVGDAEPVGSGVRPSGGAEEDHLVARGGPPCRSLGDDGWAALWSQRSEQRTGLAHRGRTYRRVPFRSAIRASGAKWADQNAHGRPSVEGQAAVQ